MSGRVGNECNRALCGFASHGQFGIWLGVTVALGLITPSFALPQQLPPGISHIDHSGAVDAADIALHLGMWGCESSVCPIPAVDLNVDGDVNAKDLSLLLANWGPATCANAPCAPPQWPVPLDIATDAKSAVDFSIHFVGLTDIAGYRAWAATVPVPLREYVDEMIWQVVKREE